MSEARTVWQDLEVRRSAAASRKRTGMMLGVALLVGMCAAEVAFLKYVAGPDTIATLTAADGMAVNAE
jgi:hypothetical protein